MSFSLMFHAFMYIHGSFECKILIQNKVKNTCTCTHSIVDCGKVIFLAMFLCYSAILFTWWPCVITHGLVQTCSLGTLPLELFKFAHFVVIHLLVNGRLAFYVKAFLVFVTAKCKILTVLVKDGFKVTVM